ncbi:LOW QUALITY PROTEIN: uncharacterized protein [Primulina eburnea]|uniref:LOW QUALITY PROTEIN: uncharacterized protein n=1 Tax=Primulina eburnea TaxID=1245227 RepID=UPI003C6BF94E
MGSRYNGVTISSTRVGVAPKAAVFYDSASSGIRAPLTVDESDFEYSASSKSRRNSTTSSYYSGSEPESEGFARGEDEGILEDTHYVEEYGFSRPFLKNPNSEKVLLGSRSYEDASFRPSVKDHVEKLLKRVEALMEMYLEELLSETQTTEIKGFKKVGEYDGSSSFSSDSDEEILEDGEYVLGYGDFRPVVAAAHEDVSENESSSVVDFEISLMPNTIIPIAQVSRDSDDDSQASEVMDDDGFSGVARVLSIINHQRLDSNRKVSVLEVEEKEVHESLAESVVGIEFVEELVVGSDCLSSKQEEQTIDGLVSADMIQNKDLEDTYEASAGSVVSLDDHKAPFESEWNGSLMPLDREFKEIDGVDERKFVGLDNHGLPADLAENTMLPENFPCDVTATEPRRSCEICKLMKLEIPELDSSGGMVEVYVDSSVSDDDFQGENQEQECRQKIDQTESVILDRDVQINKGGPKWGCPRYSDLPEAFINDKNVNQEATHKEENSEQLYGEGENPTPPADVNVMLGDMEERVFTPFSGGEILQEIDGRMATGLVVGVNSDDKISDVRQIIDSADLAGCFMDDIGVVSDGDMNQFTSVEARNGYAPRMNSEIEETLSEAQKHKLEVIQQIRVKYLQLLRRLGMFPENSIAAKVLYQLAVAESRSSSQEFHFDSDKKAAKELEVQSKNDMYFSVSILVIGKTGVGKSATINSIFGERKAVIDAFEPATTDVKEIVGMLDKVKVKIFDTPGLRPSLVDQSHNRKVLLSIKKIMQKSPPDVVLYIDRLDMQTSNFDDLPLLKLVTTYLGSSIWQKAVISFTHSSSIPPDGSNGDPLSYEVFVSQRSYAVQQMIGHARGEFMAVNPGLMVPVALVENSTFAEENKYGEKPMYVRESWRSRLLLLFYSMKILSEVNSMVGIKNPLDSGNLFGFKICSPFELEDDTSADNQTGSLKTVAVPLTDVALPPSFDGNRPFFRDCCFEPSSQFLSEQAFDCRGWDHNLGYDGEFPAVVLVQLTKDTEEFKIQLRSSVSAKHKHKRSTMAGLDVQTTGVPVTFLENQITVGELPSHIGNAASCQTQTNAAFRANTERCSKGKDYYTIVKNHSSLGLSLRKWRGDVMWSFNLQSQFSSGKNSRLHVRIRAGWNKMPSWQVCIRTSSSDQLQIATIVLLPIAKAMLRSFFPHTNKNSS